MAGSLTERLTETGLTRAREVASRIVHEAPKLADLGAEQLEELARIVVAESLKSELAKAAVLEKIPYQEERGLFLQKAGRTGSERTRKLYSGALDKLDEWCRQQGFLTVELAPAQADHWIESLKAEGRAPSTVSLLVAAASSFWTFLEGRHAELRNPFRGTRARPPRKAIRRLEVPTDDEVRIIENAAGGWLKAAINVMSQAGLRAGALPSLSISGQSYTCTTMGKGRTGRIPAGARKMIQEAGLPLRAPFKDKSVHQIEDGFRYLTKRLRDAGQIAARYSAHDLRHAFALRIYRDTRDIYATEKALGHATVGVTENYLRSIGIDGGTHDRP